MERSTKHIAVFVMTAALFAVLLLSGSLSGLKLQAGSPFPGTGIGEPAIPGKAAPPQSGAAAVPVLQVILALLLIAFIIYVSARLVGLASIRKILVFVLAIVLLIVLLNILPRVLPGPATLQADESAPPAAAPSSGSPVSPLGAPPVGLAWLAAGCLLLGTGLLVTRLLSRRPNSTGATDALAQAAVQALRELDAGNNFSGVIVRCYFQMNEVLRSGREIERPRHMTAREFQDSLQHQGVPPKPVQQLTLLFEKARYGSEPMTRLDEDAGRECLGQILQYCKSGSTEGQWAAS